MTRTQIIAVAAALATLGSFASIPARAETLSVTPLAAATFSIGSERAVGYFTADAGRCDLVVTHAGNAEGGFTASRFETSIPAAGSATYMSSVTFSCAADAQSLSIAKGADVALN